MSQNTRRPSGCGSRATRCQDEREQSCRVSSSRSSILPLSSGGWHRQSRQDGLSAALWPPRWAIVDIYPVACHNEAPAQARTNERAGTGSIFLLFGKLIRGSNHVVFRWAHGSRGPAGHSQKQPAGSARRAFVAGATGDRSTRLSVSPCRQ